MITNKDFDADYVRALKPSIAGKFFYHCLPFRKRVILNNMNIVFGDALTAAEITKLAQAFYGHLATSLKENFLMRFWNEAKIQSKAEVIGGQHIEKVLTQGKGVLILTGHFGNWEFAPIAGILNFKLLQGRFYFIRKLIGTKWIEKILFSRYYKAGLNVIPKKNSLSQACEALEQNNAVVFVMDQHACLHYKDGIKVDFFGKSAGTYRSLATIARNMEVPVIPAQSYREKDGTHVLEFYPPLEWIDAEKSREAVLKNTKIYNEQLEKMILRFPEQWLWMHKRWKP